MYIVDWRWPCPGPSWISRSLSVRKANGVAHTGESGGEQTQITGLRWAPTLLGQG